MHLFTPALAVACLLSLLTSLIAANRGPELPSYQELLFDKQLGTGDTGLSRYATSMLGAEMRNMTLDYYCRQSRAYNCLYIIGGPNILDPILTPRRGNVFYSTAFDSSKTGKPIGTGYALSPISKGELYADCAGKDTTRFTDKLMFDFSPGQAGVSVERFGSGDGRGGGYLSGYLSDDKSDRLIPGHDSIQHIGNGLDLWIRCVDPSDRGIQDVTEADIVDPRPGP